MNEKISVIVPVYNVAPYLERCLDSIIHQTYDNLEIILVDDGSTDQSGAICDAWAQKDSRIRVIHQENKGLGEARNAGLDIATGSLIAFVDSDDWLELNAYEIMEGCIARYHCDIVACGRFDQSDTFIDYSFCLDEGVLIQPREEIIRRFLLNDGFDVASWDKLYPAELFKDIRYPKGHMMCEDFVPTYKLLNKADSIYLCGQPLYHYYKRLGSITAAPTFTENAVGPVVYGPQIARMAREAYPELKIEADVFEIKALRYQIDIINDRHGPGKMKKDIRAQLKQMDFAEIPYLSKGLKTYIRFIILGFDVPYLKLYHFVSKHRFGQKLLQLFR